MQICFATQNLNKVEELKKLFSNRIEILSLNDLGITDEIEETGSTLTENALIKARYVLNNHNLICFADDSGLEVTALDGDPGVKSARYAGEPENKERNIDKLLFELQGSTSRQARFRTIIALVSTSEERIFEGSIEGEIIEERRGTNGFGYDAIFLPKNFDCTFGEMNLEEKNLISHRAKAVTKLINFLTDTNWH